MTLQTGFMTVIPFATDTTSLTVYSNGKPRFHYTFFLNQQPQPAVGNPSLVLQNPEMNLRFLVR